VRTTQQGQCGSGPEKGLANLRRRNKVKNKAHAGRGQESKWGIETDIVCEESSLLSSAGRIGRKNDDNVKYFQHWLLVVGAALIFGANAPGQSIVAQAATGSNMTAVGSKAQAAPQVVTLTNGLKYQFAGATYSTKGVPPSLEAESQFNAGQEYETPHLFVWFRLLGTNAPLGRSYGQFDTRLADQVGVEEGGRELVTFMSGFVWYSVSFMVVPRRSSVLQCNLYQIGDDRMVDMPAATITFANPLFGKYPEWKPEPGPAVKRAGDLEVSLDEFRAGHLSHTATYTTTDGNRITGIIRPSGTSRDTQTAFNFSLNYPEQTNGAWALNSAEVSDATGNVLLNHSYPLGLSHRLAPKQQGQDRFSETIHGSLWPDEAAWRLKLEFKRAFGFAPVDLATFKNVPVPAVGATNAGPITNTVGGIEIVLTQFVRRPNFTGNAHNNNMPSQVSVELPGRPAGVALDFLDMTTDAGNAKKYGSSSVDYAYEYNLSLQSIPTNAHSADITWVVQKTRSVEFLIKPPNTN
jgi:hypothetical protein